MSHALENAPVACVVHELKHTAFSVFLVVDSCSLKVMDTYRCSAKIFFDFLSLGIFEDHNLLFSKQAHVDQPVDNHVDVSLDRGKTELIRALRSPGDLVVVVGNDHRFARELSEGTWHLL